MNKKNILKCSLFLLLFFSCIQNFYAAEDGIVKVGAFQNYPVIFKDTDGSIKGFYVELLNEIALQENIHFEYIFGTWNEGLERIKNGEVDILTSVAFTPERAMYLDYCNNPILTVWGDLYERESSNTNGILEVSGKKIGVMNSDINAKNFQELTEKFGITCQFVEYQSYEDVFKAIAENKVSAGVAGITFGSANQAKYRLKSTGIIFNPINIYFTTAKNENRELRTLVDTYLEKWKPRKNSVYNQARQKWFYGSAIPVPVFPAWLVQALIALGILMFIGATFIVILKGQVNRATKKIRESEDRNKALLCANPDMMFTINKNGIFIDSDGENKNLIVPTKLFIGKNISEIMPKEVADLTIEKLNQLFMTKEIQYFEYQLKEDDQLKEFECRLVLMGESNALSIIRDVTERKHAEDMIKELLAEKDHLLREVHHRIKNNMYTIKSLLSLQVASEKDSAATESLKDAESRVQTIMMLYDKLYLTENYQELSIKSYIEPLAQEIIRNFQSECNVSFHSEITDSILNVGILTPLGIIVNELLTNSMKHAFTGRNNGNITVSISINDHLLRLIIQDDGVGIPESISFQDSNGFGMQLIRLLTDEIQGKIGIERENGTKVTLELTV